MQGMVKRTICQSSEFVCILWWTCRNRNMELPIIFIIKTK